MDDRALSLSDAIGFEGDGPPFNAAGSGDRALSLSDAIKIEAN